MRTPRGRLRQVIYEAEFEEEMAEILGDPEEADDRFQSIEWRLVRHPESGEETDVPGIWAVKTAYSLRVPRLVVYYTFDDEHVHLLSVQEAQ